MSAPHMHRRSVLLACEAGGAPVVTGWELEDVPGLVIHREHNFASGEPHEHAWTITHAASGRKVGGDQRLWQRKEGIAVVRALAPLVDWEQPLEVLRDSLALGDVMAAFALAESGNTP